MTYTHILATATAMIAICFSSTAGENLVKNGTFDDGDRDAVHWEKADGLTTLYITEEGRGRVVKMDTRIDRSQALAWQKVFAKDPTKEPPKPQLSKKTYGCIGAAEGVMLDSEFITAKAGQNYKLVADVKGKGAPFVWIKGFLYHPRRKDYVDAYQTRLVAEKSKANTWTTYEIGFNPTARMKAVETFKVRLFAYWPAGIYYFDNIRVEEITPEEMAKLVKKRSDVPATPSKKNKERPAISKEKAK